MALHDPNLNAPPFNPLPPVIVAIAVVLGGIEVVFQLGEAGVIGGPTAVGWRLQALELLGFYVPLFQRMLELGSFPPEALLRLVSYGLVHASFTHAAFAVVMILAIGNRVARVFSGLAVAVVMLAGLVAGAVVFGLIWSGTQWLFGSFPAVYALLGLFTWLLWMYPDPDGPGRMAAFRLIGALIFIQLIFAAFFGSGREIPADVAGFLAGFGLAYLVGPDAPRRIRSWRDRLRNR